MVLKTLATVVLLAGCHQSLFDSHKTTGDDDDTGGDGGGIASSCPSPCTADAGGDFGAPGKGWNYFEDHRDRSWVAMVPNGTTAVGADDPKNTITSCIDNGSAPACSALPGAMLVSSSGSTSIGDPAAQWTAPANQTLTLDLAALVQSSDAVQTIRLYRNSREDSLITLTATPGTMVTGSIAVDALANDRFLVVVSPTGAGATDVGIQLFASGNATFPQSCELALGFDGASGTSLANPCGSKATSMDDSTGAATPITLDNAPYVQLGQAAKFIENDYVLGADVLDRSGDTTTQLWVQHLAVVEDEGAWVYSDYDLDNGGGLGMDIYDPGDGSLALDSGTCTDPTPNFAIATAVYPTDSAWHFIREVQTNGKLSICIDGTQVASEPIAMGKLKSTYPPYMGKNVVWTPVGAFVNGSIDDVRVMKGALPCGN